MVGETENEIKQGASRYLIFNQFDGMDTQASRVDLPIDKQAWLENLQPIARNKLQGVPAPAAAIYSLTGETVVRTFSGIIINGTEYIIAFCASGSAYAATVAFNGYGEPVIGATVVFIAPAGTFSPTGGDVVEWNAQRILIADSISGYSTWDGNLFVRQGNASPNIAVTNGGFGYVNGATATLTIVLTTFTVTAPGSLYANGATVAISGGSGTGMTAVALVIGGKVINIQQTSPGQGYLPGDTLTVVITPVSGGSGATATGSVAAAPGVQPTASVQVSNGVVTGLTLTGAGSGLVAADGITVIITGNGGAGSGATAIAHPWPFITPFPTTLAIAFGRVWLAAGRTLIVTGTGSITQGQGYDDFNLADASVTTTLQDSDLIQQITALRYLDNYLYIVGDNSVKSIGGITVTNGVTAFSIITLSSDQGTIWPNSCISFNRLILFANTTGVHAVFGASVEKISGPMDGIFQLADYTQPLQAAVVDLNSIHTYLLLIRYRDPLAPGERSLLLGYGDRKWFVMSQGNGLTSICTAIINSISIPFGSSGADLTQLLQNTSAGVPFKISTSLSSNGDPINGKRIIRAGLGQTSDQCTDIVLYEESAELGQVKTNFVSGFRPATWVNNAGQVITWVNNSGQVITWASFGFTANKDGTTSWVGRWIGLTATGTINGIQIPILWIEYQPDAPQSSSGITPCSPGPPAAPPSGTPITPPQPPPIPPPPTVPLLWVACSSCHIVAFALDSTFTANVYPRIDYEGPSTYLTEPITLSNSDSATYGVVVDTAGGVYALNSYIDDSPFNTVTYAAATPDRNTSPTRILSSASFPASFLTSGGLALDGTSRIWVATNTDIWVFAAGASGTGVPLIHIDASAIGDVTALRYDPARNWMWALFNTAIAAYDMTGTQQRLITGAATTLNSATGIKIDSLGQIWVTNINVTAYVLTFAAPANGNIAPSSQIHGAATLLHTPVGIEIDGSGLVYVMDKAAGTGVGNLGGVVYDSAILVYASGASGNIPPINTLTGANNHLDIMDDGVTSEGFGLFIGSPQSLPGHFHPPATRFVSGSQGVGTLTFAGSARYGLLSFWTFSAPQAASEFLFGSIGGHGFTITTDAFRDLVLTLKDAAGATILSAVLTSPGQPIWYEHLISWDTNTQTLDWLVSGVNGSPTATWSSSNNVGYPAEQWRVGHSTYGHDLGLCEIYFETPASFFDPTVAGNQAKFITGSETTASTTYAFPVSLGAAGQLPTGNTPKIFLHGNGPGFTTNLGTAGAFGTITGTLSDTQNTP